MNFPRLVIFIIGSLINSHYSLDNKCFYNKISAKEISGNGRSPLLQDPLYGSRPQPYSK